MPFRSLNALLLTLPLLADPPLLADEGDPDPAFGSGGYVRLVPPALTIPPPLPVDYADLTPEALAFSHDLVAVVGHVEEEAAEPSQLDVRTFDAAGEPAGPNCGLDEAPVVPFGSEVKGLAAVVDASGHLVVGGGVAILGTEEQERPFAVRLRLDEEGCVLDPGFSDNGFAIFDQAAWCDTEDCAIVALATVGPDTSAVTAPRTFALVRSPINAFQVRLWLLALDAEGAIETGFSGDGWLEVAPPGLGDLSPSMAMAVDGRGRINLLLTHFESEAPVDLDVVLVRYTASGHLDNTIGDEGVVAVAAEADPDEVDATAEDLEMDSRGLAIAAVGAGGFERRRVLDLGAGVDFGLTSSLYQPARLAAQGDGKFVAVRDVESDDGFRVSRAAIDLEGQTVAADTTFGESGVSDLDPDLGGSGSELVVDMGLWHGRPVILGRSQIQEFLGDGAGGFLLRLESAYLFADGFEQLRTSAWSATVEGD